ncbi:DegV family protein [Pedococcus bigeumensis]|uniref:DegV family protein n=1 Tax=Pedococcus bigeumensis TaxID=433644 RepID=A0A502CJ15_9MICO|nr:DegV family protein [Pedococcus bigeumensis]TPG12938.1 DegV family protein [Pedococcus bigeumensis]
MSVAIVTDSTAYLPGSVLDAHSIQVVPLHVIVGGTEFSEGVDITTAEVAAALRAFKPVSTSRPSPQSFLDAYEKAAAGGADGIVSVHISADMSSTIESAHLAAQQSPVPVTVVDSRSLGMAMGYAVLSAAELAEHGASLEDVAAQARSRAEASTVVFYVDTLEHLRRGGRIGSASAFLGSALAIKPILGLVDGHIRPLEKVRTSSRALARLEELAVSAASDAEKAGSLVDIAVHHLDSQSRAEDLAGRLRERVDRVGTAGEAGADQGEVQVVELGAVVGAHVGPGTIAVAVSPRPASSRPGT